MRCRHAFRHSRVYSVKIGFKKRRCTPENTECIPSAVVTMTTAIGMHQTFSERHPTLVLFSIFTDLYRHLTEIAEVHNTPVSLSVETRPSG